MSLKDKHKGQTAIVCGSAPCVVEEFKIVRERRPDAIVIAVNDATAAVHADYVGSIHAEKLEEFRGKSLNPNIITIAGKGKAGFKYDHFIAQANSGATSTYSCVQMARYMGFTEIIICGAPMREYGGYFFRPCIKKKFFKFWGFGDAPDSSGMMRYYKGNLKKYAQMEDCSMVKSCCGFTAEVFGKPDFITNGDH